MRANAPGFDTNPCVNRSQPGTAQRLRNRRGPDHPRRSLRAVRRSRTELACVSEESEPTSVPSLSPIRTQRRPLSAAQRHHGVVQNPESYGVPRCPESKPPAPGSIAAAGGTPPACLNSHTAASSTSIPFKQFFAEFSTSAPLRRCDRGSCAPAAAPQRMSPRTPATSTTTSGRAPTRTPTRPATASRRPRVPPTSAIPPVFMPFLDQSLGL